MLKYINIYIPSGEYPLFVNEPFMVKLSTELKQPSDSVLKYQRFIPFSDLL